MKIEHLINSKQVGESKNKEGTSYKLGQLIRAKIVEVISENNLILKDTNGNIFNAKSELNIYNSGSDYIEFTVTNIKDDTVYIKMLSKESSTNDDKISTLLRDMGLKLNKDNIDLVKQLIKYGLPLTKDNITYMQKIKTSFTKTLEIFNNNKIVLTDKLRDTNIIEVLKEVLKYDKTQISKDNVQKNGTQTTSFDTYNIDYNKLAFLQKNNFTMNLSNLDQIRNIILEEFSFEKQINSLIHTLQKDMSTIHMANALKEISTELRNMIFDKKIDAGEIFKKLTNNILNISANIEKGKSDENLSAQLDSVKNSLEFIGKINQFQTFLQLPLLLENQQKKLELYVLKNNKNSKLQLNQNFKIFLSLNTNYLNTVQAMIETDLKNMNIKFFLDNEEDKKFFLKFDNKLKSIIGNIGYDNANIDFTVTDSKMNLLTFEEKYSQYKLNSIDVKV